MRVLEFHDLNQEDRLLFTFDGAFDQQAAPERELEPFLHALEAYAGDWMPDVVNGKRQRKYSREAVWKALEERRDRSSAALGSIARNGPHWI